GVAGGIDRAVIERGHDRTPWLVPVRAVREATRKRQLGDVGEALFDLIERDRGHHLTHTWRIDDRPTARDRHKLTMRGCVTPLAVRSSLTNREQLLTDQQVGQRRLPTP